MSLFEPKFFDLCSVTILITEDLGIKCRLGGKISAQGSKYSIIQDCYAFIQQMFNWRIYFILLPILEAEQ